jgi:hypothetical protein
MDIVAIMDVDTSGQITRLPITTCAMNMLNLNDRDIYRLRERQISRNYYQSFVVVLFSTLVFFNLICKRIAHLYIKKEGSLCIK